MSVLDSLVTQKYATFLAVNLCTGIAVLLGSPPVRANQVLLARPTSKNLLQESGQRFHPVHSSLGIVSSQERLASEVGALMLRKGGNAMDAAVATAFALSVTLPRQEISVEVDSLCSGMHLSANPMRLIFVKLLLI